MKNFACGQKVMLANAPEMAFEIIDINTIDQTYAIEFRVAGQSVLHYDNIAGEMLIALEENPV